MGQPFLPVSLTGDDSFIDWSEFHCAALGTFATDDTFYFGGEVKYRGGGGHMGLVVKLKDENGEIDKVMNLYDKKVEALYKMTTLGGTNMLFAYTMRPYY